MKNSDMIPLGSLTKAFTAAAMAQQVEKGKLHWNDTIVEVAGEIIKRDTGFELTELFDEEHIKKVTLYSLIFMHSGIFDYDDE